MVLVGRVKVCVFNPFTPFNAASSLSACYGKHQNIKSEPIEIGFEKLNVFHLPLVMFVTGGLTHDAIYFNKCLGSLLAHDEYPVVMGLLQCLHCYALLFNVSMMFTSQLCISHSSSTDGFG